MITCRNGISLKRLKRTLSEIRSVISKKFIWNAIMQNNFTKTQFTNQVTHVLVLCTRYIEPFPLRFGQVFFNYLTCLCSWPLRYTINFIELLLRLILLSLYKNKK